MKNFDYKGYFKYLAILLLAVYLLIAFVMLDFNILDEAPVRALLAFATVIYTYIRFLSVLWIK
jgi:hypothetical protein